MVRLRSEEFSIFNCEGRVRKLESGEYVASVTARRNEENRCGGSNNYDFKRFLQGASAPSGHQERQSLIRVDVIGGGEKSPTEDAAPSINVT